jgi:hypothetical protein
VELLRQHGKVSTSASKVMAELAFQEDTHPFSWISVLIRRGAETSAALRVFSQYIHPKDNAPELLRKLATDLPSGLAEAVTVPQPSLPLLWTRRAGQNQPVVVRRN